MYVSQSIQRPFGINVFGSSVLRVKPDHAALSFAVTRTHEKPAEAFAAARRAVEDVRAFLASGDLGGPDVQVSRPTLRQAMRGYGDKLEYVGYTARAGFHVHVRDLDRLEAVLAGVVEAGVDLIEGTELRSVKLALLRGEARERALRAARRKAERYAEAADVVIGRVMHIEDVNPDDLKSRRGHGAELELGEDDDQGAHDPGCIEVQAAVMVAFAIDRDKVGSSGF
ncbi:MAG: SIMPL domain-containing protein [Deltaproteobacteria bacterium]|nr:SIMPL domain-containing protein [Nannocystaceae bacterium]